MSTTLNRVGEDTRVQTYPLNARRHHGWLTFTRQRALAFCAFGALAITSLVVQQPLLFLLFLILWIYTSLVPTKDGHGIDTLISRQQRRQLRRGGGYLYSEGYRNGRKAIPSGLVPVLYQLPDRDNEGTTRTFSVIRNERIGAEIVFFKVTGWKGASSADWPVRMRMDIDFVEVIDQLTARQFFSRCSWFTLRRDAVPTYAQAFIDKMTTGANDDELVRQLRLAAEEFSETASDVTHWFAARTHIAANPDKLLRQGLGHTIPAIVVAGEVWDELSAIGMEVTPTTETEIRALMRLIHDPADEMTAEYLAEDQLVAAGERTPGELTHVLGTLTEQRRLLPAIRTYPRFLQCGDSVHGFFATKKFRRDRIPPGFLDQFWPGLSDWCITSLMVEFEPKTQTLFLADAKRKWMSGGYRIKSDRGDIMTEREVLDFDSALEEYNTLDMASGDVCWYSLGIVLSARSEEELDAAFNALQRASKPYGLVLERTMGDHLMLQSLHAVVGLT